MIVLNDVSEFQKFAMANLGISSYQFECWENAKRMQGVPQVIGSMTPYIIEERKMNLTQMDIFSRLMQDRIIYVQGVVDEGMSSIFSMQLLFLQNLDPNSDITMYLDSPGGSVKAGLTMVDTMNFIKPNVAVVNMGMAASMGSVLLSNGTKGKRSSLKHSRVMLHQVSFGAQGNIQDVEISTNEARKYNTELFNILGTNMGQDPEELKQKATRDLWLDSQESLALGIIDNII